ncbi:MAG: MmcQ/YjbR family DNA-binding protein [Acidimicrobiales bacterium]
MVARLPESQRVNIEAWDDHPTFRVRNKNFVFSDETATSLSVKLSKEEAAAVVATDDNVSPMGYGLGRHGWIAFSLPLDADDDRWAEVTEWIRTSYTLVAPKKLAAQVIDEDGS